MRSIGSYKKEQYKKNAKYRVPAGSGHFDIRPRNKSQLKKKGGKKSKKREPMMKQDLDKMKEKFNAKKFVAKAARLRAEDNVNRNENENENDNDNDNDNDNGNDNGSEGKKTQRKKNKKGKKQKRGKGKINVNEIECESSGTDGDNEKFDCYDAMVDGQTLPQYHQRARRYQDISRRVCTLLYKSTFWLMYCAFCCGFVEYRWVLIHVYF